MRCLALLLLLGWPVGCVANGGAEGASGAHDQGPTHGGFDDAGASEPEAGTLFDADTPPPKITSGTIEKRYTETLGRLIGTPRSPLPKNLVGTDLGVSFAVDGKLAFLFGDNWAQNDDSVAFTALDFPKAGLPEVRWQTLGDGSFLPLRAGSTDLGGMNVPVEGLTANGKTYVFFVTGFDASTNHYRASVLAHTTGTDFAHLVVDFTVASTKFLNVSVVQEGSDAYVFGSSNDYRKSAVYLAKVPVSQIADRSAWKYFADGAFVANESDAKPIVNQSCVGELSVRKHPRLGLYLMAYNCGGLPRGENLHTANALTGPWSAPIVIMDGTAADGGYGRTMHQRPSVVGYDDGLAESNARYDDGGGDYGPYLVPEWFDAKPTPPGTFAIVYTMSTWNPYTVTLMRTVLGAPGSVATPDVKGAGLPKAKIVNGDFATGDTTGWTCQGDPFAVFVGDDGKHRLTTFSDKKEEAVGTLSQEFALDAASSKLSFLIHGGDGVVRLYRDSQLLRTAWARRNNADFKVIWNLDEYRGDTLRVVVEDSVTGPWGFVGATDFVIE